MIYGVGTDISQVKRFEKWVKDPQIIERYFNPIEFFGTDEKSDRKIPVVENVKTDVQARHYAARFAAKEAFSKALGTGFVGLKLADFYVIKNQEGKPFFQWGMETQELLEMRLGPKFNIHLSISHEKEYAVAFVIIEILS